MQRVVKSSSHRFLFSLAFVGLGAFALLTVSIGWDVLGFARSCDGTSCGVLVGDLVVVVLLLVLFGAGSIWYLRRELVLAGKRDQRRQDAARGIGRALDLDQELISGDHPDLVLPATLRLRMNWRSRTTWLVFGILFGVLQFAFACTAFSLRNDPALTLLNAALLQGLFLLILGVIPSLMWFASGQIIGVSEEGISVRRLGRTHKVHWPEIRLFGLIRAGEYELSSARVIVRFWRPAEVDTSISTVPFPDYQRQMDALLLLIGTRTGLPLYDLISMTG